MGNDAIDGQILRMDDLVGNKEKGIIGYLKISRSSVYGMMDPKSKSYDSTFPRSIQLGAKSVGWYKTDIDEWLASRPASQSKHVGRAKAADGASVSVTTKSNNKSANAKQTLVANNTQPSLKVVQKKRTTENRDVRLSRDDADADQAVSSIDKPPNPGADFESRGKANESSTKADSSKKKPTFAAALGKTVDSAALGAEHLGRAIKGEEPFPDIKRVAKRMVKIATSRKK